MYANADLGDPESWEQVGHRTDRAWQPPTFVEGPCPFCATLRPAALPVQPPVAVVRGELA